MSFDRGHEVSGLRTAVFVVPGIPPSPNRYLGRSYQAMRKWRQEWRVKGALARLASRRFGSWDGKPFQRCAVTIRFVYPDRRRRDPDNAAAGMKTVLDMLRPLPGEPVAGYPLVDDDWGHIVRLTIEHGGVDPKNPRVEIILADRGGDRNSGEVGLPVGPGSVAVPEGHPHRSGIPDPHGVGLDQA